MAFLLSGTMVASPPCGAKLDVRDEPHHHDIYDEDYLPVGDYTESRLERQKNNETCYRKNALFYSRK